MSALTEAVRSDLARLYLASYDGTNAERFLRDLAAKHEILLVHCGESLVGFTSLLHCERIWRNQPIRVVYSGDTVVDPAHWGQQALAFGWIRHMGVLKRERPELPLYWFLLVKGHRTYRYLPAFGKSFYPHWSADRSDLKPLADLLAAEFFPDAYNESTGVVEFPESQGHLRPGLAWPAPDELNRHDVRYFLQRNPGFVRGHELVCIYELEEGNMKPLTRRVFRRDRDDG